MRRATLLRTQRNEVFTILEQAQLDPAEFEWTELTKIRIPGCIDEGIVSVLVHRPTGFRFEFDLRDRDMFWCTFAPALDAPERHAQAAGWAGVRGYVNMWAASLGCELDAPDLWAGVIRGNELGSAASRVPDGEELDDAARRAAVNAVGAVERFLESHLTSQGAQAALIRGELQYLRESTEKMDKKAWMHTLVGVLFTIVVSLALAPDQARALFAAAAHALRPLLPE